MVLLVRPIYWPIIITPKRCGFLSHFGERGDLVSILISVRLFRDRICSPGYARFPLHPRGGLINYCKLCTSVGLWQMESKGNRETCVYETNLQGYREITEGGKWDNGIENQYELNRLDHLLCHYQFKIE